MAALLINLRLVNSERDLLKFILLQFDFVFYQFF